MTSKSETTLVGTPRSGGGLNYSIHPYRNIATKKRQVYNVAKPPRKGLPK